MKLSLAVKDFSQELTATKPFASAAVTLSDFHLEPAAYSRPEPPEPVILLPADTAALMVTSLPGCAARASMDILADVKPRRMVDGANPLCCKPDPTSPRDVDAVQDGRLAEAAVGAAAAPPLRQQQHLKAQPPSPPQKVAAPRRSLHCDRDSNRARRNFCSSIDAADGSMTPTCRTCHVSEPQSPSPADEVERGRVPASWDMPGCIPVAPTPPQPQAPRQAAAAAAAATAQMTEWSFGDNLQRARMLARYAAMTAADDLRYEPSGGDSGGDSDDDTVIEASRRSRSAWKLLSSLLSSSKGGSKAAATAATASVVQRWQEATTGGAGDGASAAGSPPVGGRGNSRCSVADDGTPVVVRSRDSRRLMRVQRSRVGIDREGQRQKPPGRASVPAFTQPPRSAPGQLHPRSSAPEMLTWDGRQIDESDEVNAAIIAAAAEFVAAAAAERSP